MKKIVAESGLFDKIYYAKTYKDMRNSLLSALDHYCAYGIKEDRKPNAEFDPVWYREHYSDVKEAGVDPFLHYLTNGKEWGRFQNEAESNESKDDSLDMNLYDSNQEEPQEDVHCVSDVENETMDKQEESSDASHDRSFMTGDDINMGIDAQIRSVVASGFDTDFYFMQRPDVRERGIDPVEHYLQGGWKLGVDPNPIFSVYTYLEKNPDVRESGIEPFYHWLAYGRGEGRASSLSLFPAKELTEAEKAVQHLFDIGYYLKTYPDVAQAKQNPLVHYMRVGWREGRNPNKDFNTIHYILNNLDVITSQHNPLYHFVKFGSGYMPAFSEIDTIKKFLGNKIYHAMQDITFPKALSEAKKLFVIVVPEHNEMSGGIFSFFSIANVVRRLKSQHGYEVVLMTRPNINDITYCRQKNFPNSEDVYRFQQIERCRNLEELYLHIPEYTAPRFVEDLQKSTLGFLKSLKVLDVNILNQNYELMPERIEFTSLRELAHNLTQSVAHHSYYGQSFADKYDLPTLLLPAYTDLSGYNQSTYENKDNLIIYSLDDAPHRKEVLAKLAKELPEYELREIRGITFDYYMELATRCKFSISFGEGFDGYVAQPIYQGGIGMTVYNEEYFPSKDFLQYENFFASEEEMIDGIVMTIKRLDSDPGRYTKLNRALVAEWDKLYSYDEYVEQIKKLVNKEFELFPGAFTQIISTGNYKVGLSSKIVK